MQSIYFVILLLAIINADPLSSGGAPCNTIMDCGGIDGGVCLFYDNNAVGNCSCFASHGNPDCSYLRKNRNLAGGLQFLCFVGVGGVGNFILGYTDYAIGQLILQLSLYCLVFPLCIFACCIGFSKFNLGTAFLITGAVILVCAYIAGLIWNIVDCAYILQGKIPDALGYETYG